MNKRNDNLIIYTDAHRQVTELTRDRQRWKEIEKEKGERRERKKRREREREGNDERKRENGLCVVSKT